MRLVEFRVRNFRCYRDEVQLTTDEMTAIIGRNDSGKSSLMDALEIFFNDGLPDKNDACRTGDATDVAITCVFDELPASLVLDQAEPTTLQSENLLNRDGRLEVQKVFNGSLEKPKLTLVALRCVHPTAPGFEHLVKLNNGELKKLADERGVDTSGIDRKVNAQLRKAIRDSCTDLELNLVQLPLMEGNALNFWKGIQTALPAFALFRSDRASTDQDPEAQDPLNAAIKAAVKQKETELDAIAAHVAREVQKIAELTLQKLREIDPTLATTLSPQFPTPKWAGLFKASITGDSDIPINKRGSGVRRLILLSFFRARAEQVCRENKRANAIYAIEEPETSQHPRNQRLIVSALRDLSGTEQVLITTHTPMLVRTLPATSLRFVDSDGTGARTILVGGSEATNRLIAESLGVLADHSVKLFIGVEGKNDIPFLKNLSKVLVADGNDVPDLEQLELDGRIIFTPFGGSGLAHWTNRLAQLNRPEFHLYDRDTVPPDAPKYQHAINSVNMRPNCLALSTTKREAENYIHWQAINGAFADAGIPVVLAGPFADFDDVPREIVARVNAVNPPSDQWRETRAKEFLCNAAAAKVSKAMLDEVDPRGEVESWFAEMKRLLALGD